MQTSTRRNATQFRFHPEHGLTLVETLIAVVIGIIVLVGAFMVAGQVLASNRLANTETDLATLESGVKQLYSGQGSYNGLTDTVAQNAGVFPASMVGTGTPLDPWQGPVTLESGDQLSTSDSGDFIIRMTRVSESACVKLATFQSGSWVEFSINGTTLYAPGDPIASGSSPTTQAASDCTPGDVNSLLWVVG